MSRIGITAYDLLISCPGDVNKYVDVVKDCIDGFNTVIGRINNAEIVGRHWSTDSYSQSGDKPQELLNKQFVRDCDAAVAIFWTRFGTPTDKYGSGTEEEIEEMLNADKQVFMYFVDEQISMSNVNVEQYKKVQVFRDKYKDRGIYFAVKDEEELRRLFTNHLSMHFLPIIAGEKDAIHNVVKRSQLIIQDCNQSDEGCATVTCSSFLEFKYIKDKEIEILGNIEKLERFILTERVQKQESVQEETQKEVQEECQEETLTNLQIAFKNTDFLKGLTRDAEIPDVWKNDIENFLNRFGKTIIHGFWNVGNLTISKSLLNPMFGGGSSTLNGLDEEKAHYEEIEDVYWKIRELNEYRQYL